MRNKAIAIALVLILFFAGLSATSIYPESALSYDGCQLQGADAYLTEQAATLFKKLKLSGGLLVSQSGKTLAQIYCGTANPKNEEPISQRTVFNIGSVTKQFTGYLILSLKNEGKIGLEDSVAKYIPELEGHQFGKVTIRQLSTMTGGLPYVLPPSDFLGVQLSKRIRSSEEMISTISSLKPESQIGQFNYSNLGYNLLGIIVSKVEHMPWSESLKNRIFDPFGMKHTAVEGDKAEPPQNLAVGLLPFKILSKTFFLSLPHWNYSMIKGAGGIVSSVEDLQVWNEALTKKALVDKNWASEYFPSGQPGDESYVFGWAHSENSLADGNKVETFNHGGEDPGYCASNIRLAKGDAQIVLTTNSDYCALNEGAYRALTRAILTYIHSGSKVGFQ